MMISSLLIFLTHFCDKHGPKVLLVTQCADTPEKCQELLLPSYPTDSYCHSCLIKFPNNQNNKSIRSIMNNSYFVSSHYSSIRYQLLNSITKKIYSEETMTYDGSPMMFNDSNRGLNLVIGFKLRDPFARGNERRYGLVLTIDIKDQQKAMSILTKNWHFVVGSFNKVIEYIKDKNMQRLERQKKNDSLSSDFTPIMTGTYLRGENVKIPKNLTDLADDEFLFVRLHKWNAFILHKLGKN